MPKKFNEDKMNTVFKAVTDGKKVKDVAFSLNKTVLEIEQLYAAARRRTWAHYQRRMLQAKSRRGKSFYVPEKKQATFKRAPAVYSNTQYC